jgi:hypothetical protein
MRWAAYLDLIQYCSGNAGEVCGAIVCAMLGQTRTIGFPITSTPTPSPNRFPVGEIERVASELARYIGPLATILVHRAAKKARDWDDLYAALGAEIEDIENRRRFCSTRPRV